MDMIKSANEKLKM